MALVVRRGAPWAHGYRVHYLVGEGKRQLVQFWRVSDYAVGPIVRSLSISYSLQQSNSKRQGFGSMRAGKAQTMISVSF